MAERIVVNTGPLIALARADVLEPIGKLPFSFVCPGQVRTELDAGAAHGHPEIRPGWLSVLPLSAPPHPVAQAALDVAEAAVIELALHEKIGRVCIDEVKGRRIAAAVGLSVIGSLGLLARAKTLGFIPALRPIFEKLKEGGGWYDEGLLARVLEGVGEG